jgi:hypothetical protein
MQSQITATFNRLELALQQLTDSIAAYNPSPAAAEEVLAQDEALNANLGQCKTRRRQ